MNPSFVWANVVPGTQFVYPQAEGVARQFYKRIEDEVVFIKKAANGARLEIWEDSAQVYHVMYLHRTDEDQPVYTAICSDQPSFSAACSVVHKLEELIGGPIYNTTLDEYINSEEFYTLGMSLEELIDEYGM